MKHNVKFSSVLSPNILLIRYDWRRSLEFRWILNGGALCITSVHSIYEGKDNLGINSNTIQLSRVNLTMVEIPHCYVKVCLNYWRIPTFQSLFIFDYFPRNFRLQFSTEKISYLKCANRRKSLDKSLKQARNWRMLFFFIQSEIELNFTSLTCVRNP